MEEQENLYAVADDAGSYKCVETKAEEVKMHLFPKKEKKSTKKKENVFTKFMKKKCSKFIEDDYSEEDDICQCGLPISKHPELGPDHMFDGAWKSSEHTEKEPTDAYGELEFQGNGQETRAEFVRLSDETTDNDIWSLLRDAWKLNLPDILISVVGGIQQLQLSDVATKFFNEGIRKIVSNKGAWIITGGTNAGVMKMVGKALQGVLKTHRYATQSYCIGITPWGVVDQRDSLKAESKEKVYQVKSGMKSYKCLESNHSHFLLVDDGTVEKFWTELPLRLRVVDDIRGKIKIAKKTQLSVPTVCLVVGGGSHAIQCVLHCVKQLLPIPVVVLKGSGRAADILEFACTMKLSADLLDEDLFSKSDQLKKLIYDKFKDKSEKQRTKIYEDALACGASKDCIKIVDPEDGTKNLEQEMVELLIECYEENLDQQMYISLSWNNPEVARRTVLVDNHTLSPKVLNNAMKYCLEKDMVEFAELLLDNGVSMSKYLTMGILRQLYEKRMLEGDSILKELMKKKQILRFLSMIDANASKILSDLKFPHVNKKGTHDKENVLIKHPFNELFIWAALNNMFSMAMLLLRYGYHPLAKALIGCYLFRVQKKVASGSEATENLCDELSEKTGKLQTFAVELLKECKSTSEISGWKLLLKRIPDFRDMNCLTLAACAHHKDFIADSLCQSLLTAIWYGGMAFPGNQSLKVTAGLFFFVMIPYFPFLKEEELELVKAWHTKESTVLDDETDTEEDNNSVQQEIEEEEAVKDDMEDGVKGKDIEEEQEWHVVVQLQRSSEVQKQTEKIETEISVLRKFDLFYQAPITKFIVHTMFYVAFLLMYSVVALTKLPKSPNVLEWILFVWVVSLTFEEIHQIFSVIGYDISDRFQLWYTDQWNKMDFIAISLYYVAFGLRFDEDTLQAANILYGIDCMLWIIRVMELFTVSEYLGPYVLMIWKMLSDLMYFLFVLGIFLWSYAVARGAILHPNAKISWNLFKEALYVPYLQIFGELFIEKSGTNVTTVFGTPVYTKASGSLGILLLNYYLLVANVLLLNLLIAVFNNTYNDIQANSRQRWRYQRFQLVMDYVKRPFFPPPFIMFSRLLHILKMICNRRKCLSCFKSFMHSLDLSSEEVHRLRHYERDCMLNYIKANDTQTTNEDPPTQAIQREISRLKHRLSREPEDSNPTLQELKLCLMETLQQKLSVVLTNHIPEGTAPCYVSKSSLESSHIEDENVYDKYEPRQLRRIPYVPAEKGEISPEVVEPQELSACVTAEAKYDPLPEAVLVEEPPVSLTAEAEYDILPVPHFLAQTEEPARRMMDETEYDILPVPQSLAQAQQPASRMMDEVIYDPEEIDQWLSDVEQTITSEDVGKDLTTVNLLEKKHVLVESAPQMMITKDITPEREIFVPSPDFARSSERDLPEKAYAAPPPPDVITQHTIVENIPEGFEAPKHDDAQSVSATRDESGTPIYMTNISVEETRKSDKVNFDDGFPTYVPAIKRSGRQLWTLYPKEHGTIRSRTSPYPGSMVRRLDLSDRQIPWFVMNFDYSPPSYTSSLVRVGGSWADPDLCDLQSADVDLRFNAMDDGVNRISHEGYYEVERRGLPRNIRGRTGLGGRGLLGRWGPNHAIKVVVTRAGWCNLDGTACRSYQFVSMKAGKRASSDIMLPMAMVKTPGEYPEAIQKAFDPRQLDKIHMKRKIRQNYKANLYRLFSNPEIISCGYEDDPRNTDNAWVETEDLWIHDEDALVFHTFSLEDEELSGSLRWTSFGNINNLNPSDADLMNRIRREMNK